MHILCSINAHTRCIHFIPVMWFLSHFEAFWNGEPNKVELIQYFEWKRNEQSMGKNNHRLQKRLHIILQCSKLNKTHLTFIGWTSNGESGLLLQVSGNTDGAIHTTATPTNFSLLFSPAENIFSLSFSRSVLLFHFIYGKKSIGLPSHLCHHKCNDIYTFQP